MPPGECVVVRALHVTMFSGIRPRDTSGTRICDLSGYGLNVVAAKRLLSPLLNWVRFVKLQRRALLRKRFWLNGKGKRSCAGNPSA